MRRKNTKSTCIYWLVDTRTGVPFYCGKSVRPNARLCEHKRAAKPLSSRPVVVKVHDCGENIRLAVVEIVPVDCDWVAREQFWIEYLRKINPECANVSDGGTGIPGYIPNEQQRKNIGAATRKRSQCPEYRAKLSAAHKGRKLSPAHREKAAAHLRAITQTDEYKARNAAATEARWNDPQYRNYMTVVATGRKLSAEAREKVSASKRGKPLSAAHKAKIGDAHRGKKISAEHRAILSATHKGKEKSPEQRSKMSASAKAWRAARRESAANV